MEEPTQEKVLGTSALPVIKQKVDEAVSAEATEREEAISAEQTARENAVQTLETSIGENTTAIAAEKTAREGAVTTLETKITANTTAIATETNDREAAITQLQTQIDALENASDVVDVVSTYAQLQAYDTENLGDKSIIKVMQDSTHNDAVSYYRWNKASSEWEYVGSEGPYYTKSEADSEFVPQSRTINGQPLTSNVNIAVPTKTSDLTNDSSFVTSSILTTELGKKQNTLVSGTDIKTVNSTSLLGSGNLSLVPTSRTVNGKALSSNVTLTASDVGALASDGTAASATELATGRTIRTNLASTSSVSFNGTANITPGVTGVLPIANGGTGASSLDELKDSLDVPTKISELENDTGFSGSTSTIIRLKTPFTLSDSWQIIPNATIPGKPEGLNTVSISILLSQAFTPTANNALFAYLRLANQSAPTSTTNPTLSIGLLPNVGYRVLNGTTNVQLSGGSYVLYIRLSNSASTYPIINGNTQQSLYSISLNFTCPSITSFTG